MEYNLQKDLIYSKMRQNANRLSAKIINAHMHKKKLEFKSLTVEKGFLFGLYDKDKKPLFTKIKHPISFEKEIYSNVDGLGVVDDSSLGHKGVYFVVVQEKMFEKMIGLFTTKMIVLFLSMFVLISIIGYYLAKLFIKPIYQERKKLDAFIKDSTHELNTPITALLMSTSSKDFASEKNRQRIRLSAFRISQLYEDLTYLFLKDIKEDEREMLDIDEVIKEQLSYFKPFADKKALTFHTDIEKLQFYMDKESATRLISNLLSNAIKYTDMQIEIKISLKNRQLTIQDDGIGIDEKSLNDIFKRFYRATSTEGGFGIGLEMVKKIADRFHIAIEVSSKVGVGSTFVLRFPKS
jgi:two-component system OmpR family sensor kinase